MADDEDVTTGTEEETETDETSADEGLAEAGKKALDRERAARKAAAREARELKAKVAELEAKQAAGAQQDQAQQDAEKARRDAEAAATAKANARILRSEIKAAAGGKLNDPADAVAHIDLTQFEPDADGEFDSAEIAEAISDLIKKKPYLAAKATGFQGGGDGGARTGGSKPHQVTAAELKTMTNQQIVKAQKEGRLANLLSGT